jgi:Uma2 family endonuclease
MTPDEYLILERRAETKSEFLDGEMFAMTGASRPHNRIVLNLAFTLDSQLKAKGCEVFASDMRVKVSETGLYVYPDVAVACGKPQFEDTEVDTLLNPKVIVEVLSKTTEGYDRGPKSTHYRALPSLTEYVLVAQDQIHVEHWVRQSESWLFTETSRREDVIELPSVGARLALADVYDRVL